MTFPYEEFDVSDVHTYALKSRHSKARFSDFARPYEPGTGVPGLLDSLPNILASADFVEVVKTLKRTRAAEDGIVGKPLSLWNERRMDRNEDLEKLCQTMMLPMFY